MGHIRVGKKVSCDVVTGEDQKTVVYAVRIDNSGVQVQLMFEDYVRFYEKVRDLLPSTILEPPKKKFLQRKQRFHEKRQQWIVEICQALISDHFREEEVKEFFGLESTDDQSSEDLTTEHIDLPSERKTVGPKDFDFLKTIGVGSFGKVYQVRHKESKKIFAIKVLNKDHIRKKDEVKHVMAERNVLKENFQHPFLVSLHYSFQNKEKLYFVLDHLNGGELFSHLQKEKHFSEPRSRFYAAVIACALGFLHEKGIIYRDLKPENLLLDEKGYLVLTDFGLCKQGMVANKTTTTFCGTPEYLAPEIISKRPYDRTVDWWCLGSVLYEFLLGLPPFYSRDRTEMYERIVNQPLEFKNTVSPAATDIIQGMLQKDRTKRLGAKNDFQEIKDHPFFMPIDWDKLRSREIKAPFIPKVKSQTDTSNISNDFIKLEVNPASLVPIEIVQTQRDPEFLGFTFVDKTRTLY